MEVGMAWLRFRLWDLALASLVVTPPFFVGRLLVDLGCLLGEATTRGKSLFICRDWPLVMTTLGSDLAPEQEAATLDAHRAVEAEGATVVAGAVATDAGALCATAAAVPPG